MPWINNINIPYHRRPRFVIASVGFFVCLFTELWALHLALNNELLIGVSLHGLSSILIPWVLCLFMPEHFRTNVTIYLLLFLLCFFIPLISGICLLFSLSISLYFRKAPENKIYEYSEPLRASVVINGSGLKPEFSTGRIFGVLRFSKDGDKRAKAVLSTNQLANEIAIPILRKALLDPVDEVRLMAYGILDNKEKEIDAIIHQGLKQLNEKKHLNKEKAKIHQQLAEAYWELSYLGLVQGRAREHILHSAKHYAIAALRHKSNNVELLLLLAQILSNQGYFKKASLVLKKAEELGISPEKLAARKAELAFELKNFSQVTSHVKKLAKIAENNMVLEGMVKQWT